MKRISLFLSFLFLLALPAAAQSGCDYLYFGDNRASLPGLELMNSIYSANPAKAAEGVHNSLSFSTIFFTGAEGVPALSSLYYSLSIPNFTLVNITEQNTSYEDAAHPVNITKDLLGLQFAAALQDFITVEDFKLALGLSLFKLHDKTAGTLAGESFNIDLGLTSSFYGFNLDFILANLIAAGAGSFDFLGPGARYLVRVGSKIILDVDFILGFSTAGSFTLPENEGNIDFIGEISFRRYFFSNSLRTGVGLETFIDLDNAANQIPVVRYHIAVSYTPFVSLPDFVTDAEGEISDGSLELTRMFYRFFQNLTFNFGATMVVKSVPGSENFTAAMQCGLIKFY